MEATSIHAGDSSGPRCWRGRRRLPPPLQAALSLQDGAGPQHRPPHQCGEAMAASAVPGSLRAAKHHRGAPPPGSGGGGGGGGVICMACVLQQPLCAPDSAGWLFRPHRKECWSKQRKGCKEEGDHNNACFAVLRAWLGGHFLVWQLGTAGPVQPRNFSQGINSLCQSRCRAPPSAVPPPPIREVVAMAA